VYTLAVNEKARALYSKCGFAVQREESFAHAKGRGGCLDGVEGRARVVLLKATHATHATPVTPAAPPSGGMEGWGPVHRPSPTPSSSTSTPYW